jgi:hypothetical protein
MALVWPIPYVVIMSYTEPPANQQIAQASQTSGAIGPFGINLVVPFFPDAAMIWGQRTLWDPWKCYTSFKKPSESKLHQVLLCRHLEPTLLRVRVLNDRRPPLTDPLFLLTRLLLNMWRLTAVPTTAAATFATRTDDYSWSSEELSFFLLWLVVIIVMITTCSICDGL